MNSKELQWKCITGCGACCRLAPHERSEALSALNEEQLEKYLSMVGQDGWCINYDRVRRRCNIYENRPDFCRVRNLSKLFPLENKSIDFFAITCCRQQIRSIYGGRSLELRRFERALRLPPKQDG